MRFLLLVTLVSRLYAQLPGVDPRLLENMFDKMMKDMGPRTSKELEEDTFRPYVKSSPIVFVLFYTRSCEHCQRMVPQFEYAARKLYRLNKTYKLGTVRCEGETRDLCDENGIEMFPMIQIYKNGYFSGFYEGAAMTKEGIINEYLDAIQPDVVPINSAEEYQKITTANAKHTLIYFDTVGDKFVRDSFAKFAKGRWRQHKYYSVTDKTILPHTNYSGEIVFFQAAYLNVPWEKREKAYGLANPDPKTGKTKQFTKGLIEKWMDSSALGQVPWITGGHWVNPIIRFPRIVAFFDVNYEDDVEDSNKVRTFLYENYAKKYPEIQFATAHLGEFSPLWGNAMDVFFEGQGRDRVEWHAKEPRIIAFPSDHQSYQKMTFPFEGGKMTKTNLIPFIEEMKAGKLQNYIKSEPIPENEKFMGEVIKAVGKNFNQRVWNSGKDKFVMFHVPWCHHCRLTRPIWFALAEYYKKDPNIEFFMYNVDDNVDIELLNIQGYPSLYWIPKDADRFGRGKVRHEFYRGSRNYNDMIDFINSKATVQPTVEGVKLDDEAVSDLMGDLNTFFTQEELQKMEEKNEGTEALDENMDSENGMGGVNRAIILAKKYAAYVAAKKKKEKENKLEDDYLPNFSEEGKTGHDEL